MNTLVLKPTTSPVRIFVNDLKPGIVFRYENNIGRKNIGMRTNDGYLRLLDGYHRTVKQYVADFGPWKGFEALEVLGQFVPA